MAHSRQVVLYSASLMIIFLCLSPASFSQDSSVENKMTEVSNEGSQTAEVDRVIAANLIKLKNGQNVKLIGVNVPELRDENKLVQYARKFKKDTLELRTIGGEAFNFINAEISASGHKIKIENDEEQFDADGNILAYVFVTPLRIEETFISDGEVFYKVNDRVEIFLNAYLVKMGYAEAQTKEPNTKYKDLLLKLEKEARTNQLGIWK